MTPPPARHARSSIQILTGVAHALAVSDPTIWRRLLTDHTPDDAGHCTSCRTSGVGSPVWPCSLRVVAEQAQQLAAATHHGASGGHSDGAH